MRAGARRQQMAKGSYSAGLAGILGGVLVALVAIGIGYGSVHVFSGGEHEAAPAHQEH